MLNRTLAASITLASLCPMFLTSCAGEAQLGTHEKNSSTLDVIVGDNDLQFYTQVDDLSAAIGIMELGCTVTHIGQGLVITAGHCLSAGIETCELNESNVTWGFLNGVEEESLKTSKCVEVLAAEFSEEIDYALLRYEPAPDSRIELNLKSFPEIGAPISIFSHPNGLPLSWSGPCSHAGEYGESRFAYDCDTFSGSSGAAILDENLQIVGIHNLGSAFYQINGGTYLLDIPVFQELARSIAAEDDKEDTEQSDQ